MKKPDQVCCDPKCLHEERNHEEYDFQEPRPCKIQDCKCNGFMGD